MKKVYKILIASLMLLLSLSMFAGCAWFQDDRTVILNQTGVEMLYGDTFVLTAQFSDRKGEFTFTSSDEKVASVTSDGTVHAVGAGVATITATCGNYSATCVVTVKLSEELPSFVYIDQNIEIGKNDEAYPIDTTLTYNGVDVTSEATFEFASADPDIAKVLNDGKITGLAVGTTEVTVTATFNGKTAYMTVNVSVVNTDIAISSTHTKLSLSTIDNEEAGFKASQAVTLSVRYLGTDVSDTLEYTWSIENADIAEISTSNTEVVTVTAKKVGETNISVSFTYGEDTFTYRIPITVSYASYTIESAVIEYTSDGNGVLTISKDLPEAPTSVVINDVEFAVLDYSGNTITLQSYPAKMGAGATVEIIFDNHSYITDNGIVCTKLLTMENTPTINDFVDMMNETPGGYYVLGEDLDYGGEYPTTTTVEQTAWLNQTGYKASIGVFTGTLDGQGHCISFRTSGATIYFIDRISGTLKNIAIDYVSDFKSGNTRTALIGAIDGGTVENVFTICRILNGVTDKTTVGGQVQYMRLSALAYSFTTAGGTIKNTVVVVDDCRVDKTSSLQTDLNGVILGYDSATGRTPMNCYAIDMAGIGKAVGNTDTGEHRDSSVLMYSNIQNMVADDPDFSADNGWNTDFWRIENNNIYFGETSFTHVDLSRGYYSNGVTETANNNGVTSYSLSANCDSAIWKAEDSFEVSGTVKIVGNVNRNVGWCITDANGVQFHLCVVNSSIGLFDSDRNATTKAVESTTWNVRSDTGAKYRLVYNDEGQVFEIYMNAETTACMTYTVDEVNTFLGTTIDMSKSYVGVSMMNWGDVTSVEINDCTFVDTEN